jgi:hypothetical protein
MQDRERWAARLAAVAHKTLGERPDPPAGRAFRDDRGNHLAIDEPFFAVLRGERAETLACDRADVRLLAWLSGAGPSPDLERLLTAPADNAPAPLLPRQRDDEAIEVYTDVLLCATHAAWSLARSARSPLTSMAEREIVRRRCVLGCAWLMANLQPDNATNYPWAVHVLQCSDALGYEATHYAETLLHNCQVTYGKADLRSAWILWHAAGELRRG